MRMKTKLFLPIVSMSAVIALGLGITAMGQERASSPVRQGPTVLIPGEHGIGGMVADFEFKDLSGKTHRLGDFSNQKAIVIAMTSTSCPLSKKYLPTLAELAEAYATRDVAFVLVNDRSLAATEKRDLLTWLASDHAMGNPKDAPKPRKFVQEWTIGKPDLIVQLPKPMAIQATGTMPYPFVTAQTTLTEDRWVQAYEIVPTDRSVVHHVPVNVHAKGSSRIRDLEEGIGGYWAA